MRNNENSFNIMEAENETTPIFGNGCSDKKKKFGWGDAQKPGIFKCISKLLLNIDGRYQREVVSKGKVLRIAKEWDWRLCGTLIIARREDDSFWIIDGGHRARAALKRSDIGDLPCMVFDHISAKCEADQFIGNNTLKSSMSPFSLWTAKVFKEDPDAIFAKAIMDECGYEISPWSGKFKFAAIGSLMKQISRNSAIAVKSVHLLARIAEGEAISGRVFTAIATLAEVQEAEGKEFFTSWAAKKIEAHSLIILDRVIVQGTIEEGKGGNFVHARAICRLLNKGQRSNKLVLPGAYT